MPERLSRDAVAAALTDLPTWREEDDALLRRFTFPDFATALGFLVRIGVAAEKRDHHPELANVYNRVDVRLTTHDAGGLTEKDVDLAKAIDAIAATSGARD